MKAAFVATVLNEEKTIKNLLDSVYAQTKLPDEVIIVDGGSVDRTLTVLKQYAILLENKKSSLPLVILQKKGNRSVGRNEAIQKSTANLILCSDAGCTLDKSWVKEILVKFEKSTDVVAGYYKGKATTLFQKCLIPYVLVMEDKVDPTDFLPASRSMAFTKRIWEKVGKFDEYLSHNEDYAFAKKLQKENVNIVFAKKAIVYWIPRNTVSEAYVMFWRFAFGDAEAGIWRPKVLLLFLRYLFMLLLIITLDVSNNGQLATLGVALLFLYLYWSIKKNYRYVRDFRAFFFLPLLQFVSDFAVLCGTINGMFQRKRN